MAEKPRDLELWHRAVRDVAPLRDAAAAPRPAPAAPPPAPPADPAPRRGPTSAPLDQAAGIDRANAERLKRGRHPIEARLDLHGMTQPEAYRALAGFVGQSRDLGRRCVLVITGRGLSPAGPGILRTAVPRWLAEASLRRHILMTAPAQPRDGGAGALYLLLRRRR